MILTYKALCFTLCAHILKWHPCKGPPELEPGDRTWLFAGGFDRKTIMKDQKQWPKCSSPNSVKGSMGLSHKLTPQIGCIQTHKNQTQTNTQTNKQTNKQTNMQNKQANRQTNKQNNQTNKQTKQTNKTNRQADKQTDRQTKQTNKTNRQTGKKSNK